jgi:myo-inositol catabolism protein IolC
MALGYERPLYILAFDHRGSLRKEMFGISGEPSPAEAARISDAKTLIFDGFRQALVDGAPRDGAGVLVDEEAGAEVARAAKAVGVVVAMPVERTGRAEFEFEYGEDFGRHIEDFDPSFAKALVRYNPAGDPDANAEQLGRLKRLSDWLHDRGRRLMFELLVPAEPAQLESVGGDASRYDAELRPSLMVASIGEIQDHGVEPDVWKIEGLDRREDCLRISAQARRSGRDGVACVVLGRGANERAVTRWLRQGAGCPGYVGFAVGRTIWWEALRAFLYGRVDRRAATRQISERYRSMIDVYAQGVDGPATVGSTDPDRPG